MTESRIAVDVMGGDRAPEALIDGALQAVSGETASPLAPERVLLVGDEARIATYLAANGGDPGFGIRHASEVIEMGESPATALRAKRDASITNAFRAVKAGEAGAVVSMGNTGACVGAATLMLARLEGVHRPGIAVTLELTGRPLTLVDMGANIAPKPDHLRQYGVMGAVYTRDCLGVANPKVGLLNVGEEPSKGTELLKEAHVLLSGSDLDFVGNIEGNDIFAGAADVVVTDGFTGNVILKLLEQFAGFLLGQVVGELRAHDATWGDRAVAKIGRSIDYSEYGGALLLGVGGVVVIGHGRSDANAVANALTLADRALGADVNAHIEQGLAATAGEATG